MVSSEWKIAEERGRLILGRKFMVPIVVDNDFTGDVKAYKLIPEAFSAFQFGHAPGGHMNDLLRGLMIEALRELRRRRSARVCRADISSTPTIPGRAFTSSMNTARTSSTAGTRKPPIDLLRLVNDAPLTILFGGSGLGKTSLLRAALVPNLRQHNKLPVYIRLDPRDQRAPLVEQIASAFRAEIAARGVDAKPFPQGQLLWECLHRTDFELWSESNQLLTPVFILDQFEEMFTLGRENAEAVWAFREDLADLAENRVPASLARQFEHAVADVPALELAARRFKLLLSFREDFLVDIGGWRGGISSLARNHFRLLPMNGHQALEAVTKTGGRTGSTNDAKPRTRKRSTRRCSPAPG